MKNTFLSTVTIFLFICRSYGQTGINYQLATEFFNKANEKMLARDYTAAVNFYDAAIVINPRYTLAYYDRGIVKLNILKDTKGACLDLKKASEFEFTRADELIKKYCQ